MHRKDSNGILNSMQDGGELPEACTVLYDAWDLVPSHLAVPGGRCETPYVERFAKLLDEVRSKLQAVIDVIDYRLVYSRAEAAQHFSETLAKGLEGTVVKHPDMPWFDGDSKFQVKYKVEFDVDLKITGFNPGEPGKRTEATFGSLICESACGTLQVGVSGLKREMETYLHENRALVTGGVITVRANDIVMPSDSSTLYALSHPRFVELRRDKGEADTLPHIINQLEAARAGKATT
jgi:DNA ligase-1